jgi:hypothetical protein
MNGLELLRKLADVAEFPTPSADSQALHAIKEWRDGGFQGLPLQYETSVDEAHWLCLCGDDENGNTLVDDECLECNAKQPAGLDRTPSPKYRKMDELH